MNKNATDAFWNSPLPQTNTPLSVEDKVWGANNFTRLPPLPDAEVIVNTPHNYVEESLLTQETHTKNVSRASKHEERKRTPVCTGVLDYFPDAIREIAKLSLVANEQHNPGTEMHWDRNKSTDHANCILRHMLDRGKLDSDGFSHTVKVAWRALALLQVELETRPL